MYMYHVRTLVPGHPVPFRSLIWVMPICRCIVRVQWEGKLIWTFVAHIRQIKKFFFFLIKYIYKFYHRIVSLGVKRYRLAFKTDSLAGEKMHIYITKVGYIHIYYVKWHICYLCYLHSIIYGRKSWKVQFGQVWAEVIDQPLAGSDQTRPV